MQTFQGVVQEQGNGTFYLCIGRQDHPDEMLELEVEGTSVVPCGKTLRVEGILTFRKKGYNQFGETLVHTQMKLHKCWAV